MIRFFMTCLIVGGIAVLSGCGGGGGGGGGSSLQPAPAPTFSVSEIVGDREDLGYVDKDYANTGDKGGLKASLTNGNSLEGRSLRIEHGNSIDIVYHSHKIEFSTGENGDAKLYGFGKASKAMPELIAASKAMDEAAYNLLPQVVEKDGLENDIMLPGHYTDKIISYDNDNKDNPTFFTGEVLNGQQFLVLNGGLVELEYSSFGAWGAQQIFEGKIWNQDRSNENVHYEEIVYTPFSGGDRSALRNPEAGATFTGKAIAMATMYRSKEMISPEQIHFPGVKTLPGDARLTVDAAGNSGNLALMFPGFYDIGFQVDITGSGFAARHGSKPTVTDHGNTTGITLTGDIEAAIYAPGAASTYLQGGFYGPNTGYASEATGSFNIIDSNNSTVAGSFGVKR